MCIPKNDIKIVNSSDLDKNMKLDRNAYSVSGRSGFLSRAPDVDEGDGGVEPVEDDEGHRRVAQEGPQQLAVELDAIKLY